MLKVGEPHHRIGVTTYYSNESSLSPMCQTRNSIKFCYLWLNAFHFFGKMYFEILFQEFNYLRNIEDMLLYFPPLHLVWCLLRLKYCGSTFFLKYFLLLQISFEVVWHRDSESQTANVRIRSVHWMFCRIWSCWTT